MAPTQQARRNIVSRSSVCGLVILHDFDSIPGARRTGASVDPDRADLSARVA